MDKKLLCAAASKLLAGLVLMGLLLFIPAGTLHFPNAWLLLGILFVPMLMVGAVLARKSPELLRKRLRSKEEQGTQRKVVGISAVMFLLGFISAGVCFRFGLWITPQWVSLLASAVFLAGYGAYAEVLRENAYLSRTVEIQEGQKLVDTGLYAHVRHPMYGATVLMFLSMPLVLGSWVSFLCFLPYPLLIAKRIENEESVLKEGLPGYEAYQLRVKYRLIPYIW